jgi:hypothetical protein
VKSINNRRLDWAATSTDPVKEYAQSAAPATEKTSPASESRPKTSRQHTTDPPRGASSDPVRMELLAKIKEFREHYQVRLLDLHTTFPGLLLCLSEPTFPFLTFYISICRRNQLSSRQLRWPMLVSFAFMVAQSFSSYNKGL